MFKFSSLSELTANFPNEQTCIQYLEIVRWRGKPVSPFDATSKVYKCKDNQYKCKNTGKIFNVRYGTMFHQVVSTVIEMVYGHLDIYDTLKRHIVRAVE